MGVPLPPPFHRTLEGVATINSAVPMLASQLLNGLAYSMLIFLLAAGLSLTFGMMDVLNLAHGSFYMLGAYLGFTMVTRTGNFWLALLVVPPLVALAGMAVEYVLLRRVASRTHLDQVLLTLGLAFVIMDLVRWQWGGDVRSILPPDLLSGSLPILGRPFPVYRLFVIVFGLLQAALLGGLIERSRLGAVIRAGVSDREMASGIGVNIPGTFTLVFGLGTGLAGLSGVVAGPFLGMAPGMDFETLLIALIVVVVGGMGTLSGAFWGSLLIGLIETLGKVFFPQTALFLVYAAMAAVLLLRPQGLFGKG